MSRLRRLAGRAAILVATACTGLSLYLGPVRGELPAWIATGLWVVLWATAPRCNAAA